MPKGVGGCNCQCRDTSSSSSSSSSSSGPPIEYVGICSDGFGGTFDFTNISTCYELVVPLIAGSDESTFISGVGYVCPDPPTGCSCCSSYTGVITLFNGRVTAFPSPGFDFCNIWVSGFDNETVQPSVEVLATIKPSFPPVNCSPHPFDGFSTDFAWNLAYNGSQWQLRASDHGNTNGSDRAVVTYTRDEPNTGAPIQPPGTLTLIPPGPHICLDFPETLTLEAIACS